LLTYVGKLKKSKDIYDKMVGKYEINNLNHILSLKNQLKDMKKNKGGICAILCHEDIPTKGSIAEYW